MRKIMTNEYADRFTHWLRVLRSDFYQELEQIPFKGFTTFDDLTPGEAADGPFHPVEADTYWGKTWEYMWLRGEICLPEKAAGRSIVLNLGFDGEATLFVNGEEFGTKRAEWVQEPHHYMEDNFITLDGRPGEKYQLLIEVYAGHYYPDAGGCATGPVLPDSFGDPLQEGKRRAIHSSSFGIWNEDAYQLYMDLSTLFCLYQQLPEGELRTAQIADALEQFTHAVDFEQPPEKRTEDYRRFRKMLKPVMDARNGSCQATMYAVGNSHLDLAWLWPMAETRRKTARTFAQQLRLLQRYPEYRYIQSQPAAYEMCAEKYPGLYRRIREAAAEGRWIADGAMYVEPDTNMSSGEALIRQLIYGKAFYRKEFNVDSRVLWLPDTFGYSAVLPQILKKCGVDYLVTQKIFWSYNDADDFPYHYFRWRGMDGSAVTAFLPTSYTYRTDPEEVCETWNQRRQKRNLDAFLMPFGYGDGGGGPTRDHIEYALRERDLQGMPKMEFCSPQDFFTKMEEKGGPVHTWDGELYFSAHRGTYTTQARIKKNNRRGETALCNTDLWNALGLYMKGTTPDYDQMRRLWKQLLLNQFHDILPGSGIARIYQEANQVYSKILEKTDDRLRTVFAQFAAGNTGITFFNSLSWDRTAVVPVDDRFTDGAVTKEGKTVPVFNGQALVTIPAVGSVSLLPARTEPEGAYCRAAEADGMYRMENDRITVLISRTGELISWQNRETGMVLSGGCMNHLMLYRDVPRKFDAWDIDSMYEKDEIVLEEAAESEIVQPEGLEVSVLFRRKIGASVFEQKISLQAGREMVFFETRVDWHELHRLLKVRFDCGITARNALHEIQFGYVERPTHRSSVYDQTRFEVCNHRYTALCDNGRGFAVLNDCKYGVSTKESSIDLTLLRAAASPEMRTDQGEHTFRYAFFPWQGTFADSNVVRFGYELNQPVYRADGSSGSFSAFRLSEGSVILETVKLAEDESGDLILRLYESKRSSTICELTVGLEGTLEIAECTMLEVPAEEYVSLEHHRVRLAFRPFEIRTFRIRHV